MLRCFPRAEQEECGVKVDPEEEEEEEEDY